ncbi:sugar nucleotide-binding protein [Salinactinospora qingdaonensis]|uniref:Sugar nucleotide-binding protein n=1 Tax=Salinactinospora qingdaonensis TaxID=702744 RepID=A0ABP7G4U9_9ACTN
MVVNAAYAQQDWEATAVGPVHIAWACNQEEARLVHISSDAVFCGDLDSYDEICAPSPMTRYGAAKAAAEVGVIAAMGDAVVVRTSWILGDGNSGFEAFVRALANGEADGALFDDDIRCPVHIADLAAAVLEVGRLNYGEFTGLLHVAGSDALSRYELGCLIAERDGLEAGILPKASKSSVGVKGMVVRLDASRSRGLLTTKVRGAHEFTASNIVPSADSGSRT